MTTDIENRIEETKLRIAQEYRKLGYLERYGALDERVLRVKDCIAGLEGDLLALTAERTIATESHPVDQPGTEQFVSQIPLSPSQLSDQNLIELIRNYSERSLFERYADKYYSDCYSPRPALQEHFANFLNSDRSTMVVTGKAGTGKSAFVCNLVDSPPVNCIIWLQDCTDLQLDAKLSVDDFIGQSLGLNSGVFAAVLPLLQMCPDQKIVFIFDSVNEFPDSGELLRKLAAFVRRIEDQRIKVMLTCRMPMWRSIARFFAIPTDRAYHVAGPGSNVTIDKFDEREIEMAYERYREAYQIKNHYHELSPQVKHLIQQPLFLNLTAIACENGEIPRSLALQAVFSRYVEKCLGEEGFESVQFTILQRIVELMYKQATRQLELAIVKNDREISRFVVSGPNSPYAQMINEGLLSEGIEQKLIRRVQTVFVTYDRVFEFLLAEIISGDVTPEAILRNLEIAQTKPFIHLRGAVELALSFSVMRGDVEDSLLLHLARLNRPDSRQFICDVIQTISDSGHKDRAERIVLRISKDVKIESKYVAVQAAYQLGLDEQLLDLALSRDSALRNLATIYIYERWNAARLAERLDDGYDLLRSLKSRLSLKEPTRAKHVIEAAVSVGGYMMAHAVDDPASLRPLVDYIADAVKTIPGVSTNSSKDRLTKFAAGGALSLFVELLAQALSGVTSLDDVLEPMINEPQTIRAAVDVGEMLSLESLTEHKEKIIRLLSWPNPFIGFSASSLTINQVDLNPEENIPLFISILHSSELGLTQRLLILRGLALGLIARMVQGKSIPEGIQDTLFDYLLDLWYEIDAEQGPSPSVDKLAFRDPPEFWQSTLYALFVLEAEFQQNLGNTKGSELIARLVDIPYFSAGSGLNLLLKTLQRTAYQDYVNYAIMSITRKELRFLWEQDAPEFGITILSDVRALYQEEVDSLLQDDPSLIDLWNIVRTSGHFPNPKDVRSVSSSIWTLVAIGTNMTLAKTAGLCLMELSFAKSITDYWRRLVRLIIEVILDPTLIDIAHVEWGLAHDCRWDRFDKLRIPRGVMDLRPEIHEHYKMLIELFIKRCGRGIFHEEL